MNTSKTKDKYNIAVIPGDGIGKELVKDGDEIEVDMESGTITSMNGETITFKKLPPFMLEILEQGGLIEYLKNKR